MNAMVFHPLIMDLDGWPVVVIGGGEAASGKVSELLGAGAEVTVVSPELTADLHSEAAAGRIRWLDRPYRPRDLRGSRLVFAATAWPEVNAGVAEEARRRGIPCNLSDDPEHSTLLAPAFFQRGPLIVAISAGGASAVLDDRLRRRLELDLPPLYGSVAEIVHRYAEKAREQIADKREQKAFLRDLVAFLDGPEVHEDLARGHLDGAVAGAKALLEKHAGRTRPA
jgi:uroporphyrin-III C-methyltransferase/precorrin-2 dehydrogenase/sirohydrochlorin ferrochelatase